SSPLFPSRRSPPEPTSHSHRRRPSLSPPPSTSRRSRCPRPCRRHSLTLLNSSPNKDTQCERESARPPSTHQRGKRQRQRRKQFSVRASRLARTTPPTSSSSSSSKAHGDASAPPSASCVLNKSKRTTSVRSQCRFSYRATSSSPSIGRVTSRRRAIKSCSLQP
ncbi:hypothetical protein BDZ90DRAFT_254037, partial [Jaminaea rosea]